MQSQDRLQPSKKASVATRAWQGAGIALLLITVFLLLVRNPDPAWSRFWMLRPLIIVPCGGAIGGVLYYLMNQFRQQSFGKRLVVDLISLVAFVFCLWLSFVLGLDGTLWD